MCAKLPCSKVLVMSSLNLQLHIFVNVSVSLLKGDCEDLVWNHGDPVPEIRRLGCLAQHGVTLTAGSGGILSTVTAFWREGNTLRALSTMVMVFRENILATAFWWCLLPRFVILLILLQGVCIISHPCIWWCLLKPFLLGMYCSQSGHVYDFTSICIWSCLLKPLLLGIYFS